ncbi:MAG: hypothetical protein AB7T38_00870 [Nitrospirales bacterium]
MEWLFFGWWGTSPNSCFLAGISLRYGRAILVDIHFCPDGAYRFGDGDHRLGDCQFVHGVPEAATWDRGWGHRVEAIFRHRRLGYLMQWTFGGIIITTYVVYDMLFYWFLAA